MWYGPPQKDRYLHQIDIYSLISRKTTKTLFMKMHAGRKCAGNCAKHDVVQWRGIFLFLQCIHPCWNRGPVIKDVSKFTLKATFWVWRISIQSLFIPNGAVSAQKAMRDENWLFWNPEDPKSGLKGEFTYILHDRSSVKARVYALKEQKNPSSLDS